MKRLGVFLLPPGWDASPSQSYPPALSSPVPIYTPGWRGAQWELSVLPKNTTQCMSPARARTRTARSGDERTNHEATAPPTLEISITGYLASTQQSKRKRKLTFSDNAKWAQLTLGPSAERQSVFRQSCAVDFLAFDDLMTFPSPSALSLLKVSNGQSRRALSQRLQQLTLLTFWAVHYRLRRLPLQTSTTSPSPEELLRTCTTKRRKDLPLSQDRAKRRQPNTLLDYCSVTQK